MSAALRAVDRLVPADVVVVGAGVAGLTTALELAPLRVALLTAGMPAEDGATPLAHGGVAAPIGAGDDAWAHAGDIYVAAAGLGEFEHAWGLAIEAAGAVEWLIEQGVAFERRPDGRPLLSREGTHGTARTLRVRGATGRELAGVLTRAAQAAPHISWHPRTRAVQLLRDGKQLCGLLARGETGEKVIFRSPHVVLATGGIGGLYAATTNLPTAIGTGLALAARAGARLADLEFVQFAPTALAIGDDPRPIVSPVLQELGARLIDHRGEPLRLQEPTDGEPVSAEAVGRAIARRIAEGGAMYLDAREAVAGRLPGHVTAVLEACRRQGIEPSRQPIPVVPAAHYHVGGIWTDAQGRTTVSGLWACGECASTGVHGACTLASSSLLEAVVMGRRIGRTLAALPLPRPAGPRTLAQALPRARRPSGEAAERADRERESLRRRMAEAAGVDRCGDGLATLAADVESGSILAARLASPELSDFTLVARLVALAALVRRESRGTHLRADHPREDPGQRRRLIVRLAGADARAQAAWVGSPRRVARWS